MYHSKVWIHINKTETLDLIKFTFKCEKTKNTQNTQITWHAIM